MFALALAATFRDGRPCRRLVDAMAAAFPATPADGTRAADAPHASAAVLRWSVVARDRQVTVHWNAETQTLFTGDVRLYNRRELARELGLGLEIAHVSDLELAWLAFGKWSRQAPQHLVGDFAIVAWDERQRCLFAARDHLGVRPLYYATVPGGFLVASDVRQLLPILAEHRRALDDVNEQRILQRLVPPLRRGGETYFKQISPLRPGHTLSANLEGHREERYWFPPPSPGGARSYRDNCDELASRFRQAVKDRLESDHPIVAHSSGGFDSSTILMAASAIYEEEPRRSQLVMASALSIGYDCDDSPYMDAVAARVGFESVRWTALDSAPDLAPLGSVAYPGFARGPAGGPTGDLALAQQRGARVLIGGAAGDDVLFAGGIYRDLVGHGRLARLIDETLIKRRPLSRGLRTLARSASGLLPPLYAQRLNQQIFGRPPSPPDWLGPRLREIYPPRTDPVIAFEGLTSHTAFELWSRLASPQFAAGLSGMVLYGSEHGLEVRLPFSDIRLAEHMLTIPWDQRIPRGHLRRTGRDALASLLPAEFSSRVGQKPWTPVWAYNARAAAPFVASTIIEGPWLSSPFVDRQEARRLLSVARAEQKNANDRVWLNLLDFAALETWLRRLICYNPGP